ncbi:uncharacterized protein [Asterias amurensis]|uniref:uncharacterized protein isoform X2 n=1 Tax=Asterias amurensis TaxID=7602 RepID=UPI003AB6336D
MKKLYRRFLTACGRPYRRSHPPTFLRIPRSKRGNTKHLFEVNIWVPPWVRFMPQGDSSESLGSTSGSSVVEDPPPKRKSLARRPTFDNRVNTKHINNNTTGSQRVCVQCKKKVRFAFPLEEADNRRSSHNVRKTAEPKLGSTPPCVTNSDLGKVEAASKGESNREIIRSEKRVRFVLPNKQAKCRQSDFTVSPTQRQSRSLPSCGVESEAYKHEAPISHKRDSQKIIVGSVFAFTPREEKPTESSQCDDIQPRGSTG